MSKPRPSVEAERRFRVHRERLAGKPLPDVFSAILQENIWGSRESASGLGSELDATAKIRRELPELMQRHGALTLLDIPCGDCHWMAQVDLAGYIGADIVADLVERNRLLYPAREFMILDLTRDRLPGVDLVFCRDCLVHLSFANVSRALENLRSSGARWLLTTTFPGRGPNDDIADGDWRPLDLQSDPFCWPEPLELVNEECAEEGGAYRDKSLGLWRISDLPTMRPPAPAPVG